MKPPGSAVQSSEIDPTIARERILRSNPYSQYLSSWYPLFRRESYTRLGSRKLTNRADRQFATLLAEFGGACVGGFDFRAPG